MNFQVDYNAMLDELLVDGQLPQTGEIAASGLQPGLCTAWFLRQPNSQIILGWVNKLKMRNNTHINEPFIQSLQVPFKSLCTRSLYAGINSPVTLGSGKNWIIFPHDAIIDNKSQADGTTFTSGDIVFPVPAKLVSGIVIRDEEKVDVSAVVPAVEFCQMFTAVPGTTDVTWITDKDTRENQALGIGVSGAITKEVNVKSLIDPPSLEDYKRGSAFAHVYLYSQEYSYC